MAESISELAMCAVRYALGRMTYVSYSVPQAIMTHSNKITTHALHIMLRDIREYRKDFGKIGMDCDDESWAKFENWLEKEINGRRESLRKQN